MSNNGLTSNLEIKYTEKMAAEFTKDCRYFSISETFAQHFMTFKFRDFLYYNVTTLLSDDIIKEDIIRKRFRILSGQHYVLRSQILLDENEDFYLKEMI